MKDFRAIRVGSLIRILVAILVFAASGLAQSPPTLFTEDQLRKVFTAAREELRLFDVTHYRLGVFEKERTDSSCIVSYFDSRVYEIYSFSDSNDVWRKDFLFESYYMGMADTTDTIGYLNKSSVYEDKVADIWQLFSDDPHPGLARYASGHDVTGNYLETWTHGVGADSAFKFKQAKFYPGTETKDYKVWTVSLISWMWHRYISPVFSGSSTTASTVNTTYNGEGNYGAEQINWYYHLQVDPAADIVLENKTLSTMETYEATNSITAGPNVTVTSTGDVTFRAGSEITLLPGFTAVAGSDFHAYIDEGLGLGKVLASS